MPKYDGVSSSVIRRLPRYYRFLGELLESGVTRISSRELAERMGLTASQIRQDLNCFGGFGQQGYGYNVALLHKEIDRILGLSKGIRTILIGAGNLGRAIANHMSFENKGFNLIGIFDSNPQLTGSILRDVVILEMDQLDRFCEQNKPEVAILCIPPEAAKELCPRLIQMGVKGFWNFSHYDIHLDFPQAVVENAHLGDSLMTLCYRINDVSDIEESSRGED